MKNILPALLASVLFTLVVPTPSARAQDTAWTYQGRLNDAAGPANGTYDLTFTLFNAASGGATVGTSNVLNDLAISNGLFTAALDYGAGVFDGTARWLQIAVRPGVSAGSFTNLDPRQPITAAPYAVRASSAGSVGGQTAANVADGASAANAATSANTANTIVKRDAGGSFGAGGITGTNFTGNGGGLTNLNGASLLNNSVGSNQLADSIALGSSTTDGRLEVYRTSAGTPAIILDGLNNKISTYGDDGFEQTRLYGPNWGELLLFNNLANNATAVNLTAQGSTGGRLSLNNTNGSSRAILEGENTGGTLTLYTADGSLTVELAAGGNSYFTSGNVGIGLANPLFPLHIGTSLGVGAINGAAQRAVVENATANGRAALLLLAGPAASASATNRVEVQVEASDSERRAIIGTVSDHEVQFRQNNRVRMTLSTNGNVGLGTGSPASELHVVSSSSDCEISVQSGDAGSHRWTLQGSTSSAAGQLASSFQIIDRTTPAARLLIDTSGRVGIGKNNPATALDVNGTVTAIAFNPPSDRNLKENFTPVSPREVLEKVASLPISRWNFKGDAATPHVGPMAQDFHAAFRLGTDERHIATVDADGVALAAIQGLNEKLEGRSQKAEESIQKLQAENAELKQNVAELKRLVETLVKKGGER